MGCMWCDGGQLVAMMTGVKLSTGDAGGCGRASLLQVFLYSVYIFAIYLITITSFTTPLIWSEKLKTIFSGFIFNFLHSSIVNRIKSNPKYNEIWTFSVNQKIKLKELTIVLKMISSWITQSHQQQALRSKDTQWAGACKWCKWCAYFAILLKRPVYLLLTALYLRKCLRKNNI